VVCESHRGSSRASGSALWQAAEILQLRGQEHANERARKAPIAMQRVEPESTLEKPSELQERHDSGTWDKVDQAAWESFPASDPPGHAPSEHVPQAASAETETEDLRTSRKLLRRHGRELLRTEAWMRLHCQRETERLGSVPPAEPLRAAGHHADAAVKYMMAHTARVDFPLNVASTVAGLIASSASTFVLDRVLSSEQAYRSTLLSMKRGVDLVKMMNQLAQRSGELELIEWTDSWLRLREAYLQQAEAQLGWFADKVRQAEQAARPLFATKRR